MRTMKGHRSRKGARGSILLLAIFFLIVLFSLSAAFFRIIPAEYHSAANSRRHIQATYAADAGVRNAVTWLKATWDKNKTHVISAADIAAFNTQHLGSEYPAGVGSDWPVLAKNDTRLQAHKVDENWSYLTHIRMNDNNFFLRVYEIESASYFNGRPVTVVKSTVQNESFARFALFYDVWSSSSLFSMAPNGIQGPVHTNGFFRLAAPNAAFWTATQVKDGQTVPADPWVSGPLARMTQAGQFSATSTDPVNTLGIAGDGIQYANGNSFQANWALVPYTTTGSPEANRYNKIVQGGRENISQIEKIPMPESNSDLRLKAWGATPPTNTAGWDTAVNGAGTVLVNTENGHPNVPGGKVTGGIFIRGANANNVLLDITEEGHQVTRVHQGNTVVEDPTNVTYWADVPTYHAPVYERPRVIAAHYTRGDCTRYGTRQVENTSPVEHSAEVTEANAERCGTHQETVGEGGVTNVITVPNTCTFTVTWTTYEPNGTFRTVRGDCEEYGPDRYVPEQTVWEPGVATDPGARQNGWTTPTTDSTIPGAQPTGQTKTAQVDSNYPGAEPRTGTRQIENWNSVVEVNDSSYKIPYYPGVKVNGETITNPGDPRLTISDGHTVTIKNDYKTGSSDYAEYTVMEGRINGVVFSDVHLYNVRGTAKGSKYDTGGGAVEYKGKVLATNIADGKNIEIRDSILQYYDGADANLNDGSNRLVTGKTSPDQKHILGLFANEILIKPSGNSKNYDNTRTAWREANSNGSFSTVAGRTFRGGKFRGGINVYAILMAGRIDGKGKSVGGFGAHSSAMENPDDLGDFNLYGGIISAQAKLTQQTVNGSAKGFRLHLNYDQIAAEFLEYFPPTNIFNCLRYVTYHANPRS